MLPKTTPVEPVAEPVTETEPEEVSTEEDESAEPVVDDGWVSDEDYDGPEAEQEQAPAEPDMKSVIADLQAQVKALQGSLMETRHQAFPFPDMLDAEDGELGELDPIDPESVKAHMAKAVKDSLRAMRESQAVAIREAQTTARNAEFIGSHPDAKEYGQDILSYMDARNLGPEHLETAYWAVVGPKLSQKLTSGQQEVDEARKRLRRLGVPSEIRKPSDRGVPTLPPESDKWSPSRLARWYEAHGLTRDDTW